MRLPMFAAVVLCVSSLAAHADTFSFTLTGADTGSGTLTGTETSTPDKISVSAITGVLDGHTITSLLAKGAFANNDNLLFLPPEYIDLLDFNGISFGLSDGDKANLFGDGVGPSPYGVVFASVGLGPTSVDTLVVSRGATSPTSVTPEPSSIALLGTGLLGVAGVARRRLVG